MQFVLFWLTLTSIVCIGQNSKILGIFPIPSKSHYILGQSLLHGLANRGHEVTMISPFSVDRPIKNFKEIVVTGVQEAKDDQTVNYVNGSWWEKLEYIALMFPQLFDMTHNHSKIRDFANKGEKYDLCIVSIMGAESMLGICNAVHAPAIGFSLVGLNSFISFYTNNPTPYSYVPSAFFSLTEKMNFIQRVQNMLTWMAFDGFIKFIDLPYHQHLLEKYYPKAPTLEVLLDNVDIFLLNSHISTDSPKPLLPNIIPIGGFHLQMMEEIPKDLKSFLDNSKNGVIYFNLGSNMKSSKLDEFVIDTFTNVFAQLDYDVLWKFEKELPNKPRNLRIEKWLPQRSILKHPNVKVFMTHGGLGSTVEAIYGAVPMICMPIFGDQGMNCAKSAKSGYAIVLKFESITEENLITAIKEILYTHSYKEKILFMSDLYKNQEVNPMEKAIFWIEHVIRHKGAKHLKSQASNIPFYQYYLLDVISFLCLVLFIIICFIYFIIKINFKVFCWLVKIWNYEKRLFQNGKISEKSKKLKIN